MPTTNPPHSSGCRSSQRPRRDPCHHAQPALAGAEIETHSEDIASRRSSSAIPSASSMFCLAVFACHMRFCSRAGRAEERIGTDPSRNTRRAAGGPFSGAGGRRRRRAHIAAARGRWRSPEEGLTRTAGSTSASSARRHPRQYMPTRKPMIASRETMYGSSDCQPPDRQYRIVLSMRCGAPCGEPQARRRACE